MGGLGAVAIRDEVRDLPRLEGTREGLDQRMLVQPLSCCGLLRVVEVDEVVIVGGELTAFRAVRREFESAFKSG